MFTQPRAIHNGKPPTSTRTAPLRQASRLRLAKLPLPPPPPTKFHHRRHHCQLMLSERHHRRRRLRHHRPRQPCPRRPLAPPKSVAALVDLHRTARRRFRSAEPRRPLDMAGPPRRAPQPPRDYRRRRHHHHALQWRLRHQEAVHLSCHHRQSQWVSGASGATRRDGASGTIQGQANPSGRNRSSSRRGRQVLHCHRRRLRRQRSRSKCDLRQAQFCHHRHPGRLRRRSKCDLPWVMALLLDSPSPLPQTCPARHLVAPWASRHRRHQGGSYRRPLRLHPVELHCRILRRPHATGKRVFSGSLPTLKSHFILVQRPTTRTLPQLYTDEK
mmetsp:Transcript_31697/g.52420  ORF Transcript_31697/g.52420 Transcript_31697/m.52420 type:complete len:329 (-) Transcript_31697:224-1210(-)